MSLLYEVAWGGSDLVWWLRSSVLAIGAVFLLKHRFVTPVTDSQFPPPPGPPADPILGHARYLPKTFIWNYVTDVGKKYGSSGSLSTAML